MPNPYSPLIKVMQTPVSDDPIDKKLAPLFKAAEELRADGDKLIKDFATLKEKVELLTGERGDKIKSRSAVRRIDMLPISTLALKSKRVSSIPSSAEFNALQDDVDRLYRMLTLISNALGNAKITTR